ncbi:thioredoxin family protein [Tautonia plasticadhaerens]|uniref:Thioredoxin n=1 Tax=Tautonia plasticadhaerens TaxID=2527974 RepID=A0A518H440_9BACT|nr:thioredoxin domain-containing protein [Tautonia plasticadhaerens]QDV35593.1 Thioredoxin [Tautonia plasticadhaerens]
MARQIRGADWEAEVLRSPVPVLVDLYSKHCNPCQALAPLIDRLAGEYGGKAKVLKLNIAEGVEVATALGVSSVPTVVAFRGGNEVGRLVGLRSEQQYRRLLGQAGVE